MKNLLLLLCAFTLITFSCTQEEEIVDNRNSEMLPTLILENEAKSNNTSAPSINELSQRGLDLFVCSRNPLVGDEGEEYGYVDFSLAYNKVIITYTVYDNILLLETNLSLVDQITSFSFPMDADEELDVAAFEFSVNHGTGVTEYTYYIDQDQYADIYMWAAHAVVQTTDGIDTDEEEAWGAGEKFTPESEGMYAQMAGGKCGAEYLYCFDENDYEFYIPLNSITSGSFPAAGSVVDVVSVTKPSPTSEGVLDLELEFNDIPPKFGNAVLSITFDDLDLNPDVINHAGNTIVFSETLELRDDKGNLIVRLDETSGYDDDFVWTYNLPNDTFKDGKSKVKFYVTLTANLQLIDGAGLQVQNTIERMTDISICGLQYGAIE